MNSHQNRLIIFKRNSFGDQLTFSVFAAMFLRLHRRNFDIALQSACLRPQKDAHAVIPLNIWKSDGARSAK